MKAWWPVFVAVVVPGGSLIAFSIWLRRRWMAREAAAIDLTLAIKREILDAQLAGQVLDESLQATAKARRVEADKKRREAAQIASGKPAALIRRVG